MKQYVYIFTRQDIAKEHQLVQTGHVALKLGYEAAKNNIEMDPDNTYFTCIGVRNLEALDAVRKILRTFGYRYELFFEPDLKNGEITSIATYSIDEDKRDVLLAFSLLRF